MKRIINVLISISLLLTLTGCKKTYNSVSDYHMIYDNVTEANKTFTKAGQKETLLSFAEYTYCSYLLLFPREQPEYLMEFAYSWQQSIDYDDYLIYFSYRLNDASYDAFKRHIADFSISYADQENKPIYTENLFEYPTYLLSWCRSAADSGFCEYIMLDDETNTVINVYKMFYELDTVQENATYNILPMNSDYDAVDQLVEEYTGDTYIAFAKHSGYSVYAFEDTDGTLFVPSLEELTYRTDFLSNS